ncbi:hypothetical protein [Herbaspirillum sp. alder98]|uniref:hypothetical protein n=1 Tax=Herbaspirillum sp. alder98 TaxID=2913096 RepID=UPI001CD880F7|nr:hypothetical protein [Herbaspirillum sp. alder98]MCA1325163.1 hypothetical protein [Herbaspirillum sp. alder98]
MMRCSSDSKRDARRNGGRRDGVDDVDDGRDACDTRKGTRVSFMTIPLKSANEMQTAELPCVEAVPTILCSPSHPTLPRRRRPSAHRGLEETDGILACGKAKKVIFSITVPLQILALASNHTCLVLQSRQGKIEINAKPGIRDKRCPAAAIVRSQRHGDHLNAWRHHHHRPVCVAHARTRG